MVCNCKWFSYFLRNESFLSQNVNFAPYFIDRKIDTPLYFFYRNQCDEATEKTTLAGFIATFPGSVEKVAVMLPLNFVMSPCTFAPFRSIFIMASLAAGTHVANCVKVDVSVDDDGGVGCVWLDDWQHRLAVEFFMPTSSWQQQQHQEPEQQHWQTGLMAQMFNKEAFNVLGSAPSWNRQDTSSMLCNLGPLFSF